MPASQRLLRGYAFASTALLVLAGLTAFRQPPRTMQLDELTVRRINVVDGSGRTRVILAGSFPPRRTELAGLLFNNAEGTEAGGLVYRGRRLPDGRISASGTLTMDQYDDDQIVALQYTQEGLRRQQGLTVMDRPDSLTRETLAYYQKLDRMPPGPARDSVLREFRANTPAEQLAARRVFVGRDTGKAAVLHLADRSGKPRLRIAVDSAGRASISFLDAQGRVTRVLSDTDAR